MKGLKAFLKFVPVFVLAGLMIFGKGHLFDGQDAMIAAPLAFLAAVIIAMLVEKKKYIRLSENAVSCTIRIQRAADCFRALSRKSPRTFTENAR